LEVIRLELDSFLIKRKGNKGSVSDMDLNRNATKYRDNHIHKDAAGIMLHFINGKY